VECKPLSLSGGVGDFWPPWLGLPPCCSPHTQGVCWRTRSAGRVRAVASSGAAVRSADGLEKSHSVGGNMADAGWYRDPTGETQLRYYDGARWTDEVRPFDAPAETEVPHVPARGTGPLSDDGRHSREQVERLGQYEQHKDLLCLECGYDGPMGVVNEGQPSSWFLRWPGFFLMAFVVVFLLGVHFIISMVIAFAWGSAHKNAKKATLHCPQCEQHVLERK
jgi:hypothetical protein